MRLTGGRHNEEYSEMYSVSRANCYVFRNAEMIEKLIRKIF